MQEGFGKRGALKAQGPELGQPHERRPEQLARCPVKASHIRVRRVEPEGEVKLCVCLQRRAKLQA